MAEPNLFIIGAPKCATTSLYDHLSCHSAAQFSTVKEPGYFTRARIVPEMRKRVAHLASEEAYLALYADAEPGALVCDGSTSYLRAPDALAEIAGRFAEAKVIAVVRDPVEVASSYFEFLKYEGMEVAPSLAVAWELQAERAAGRLVPPQTRRPDTLQYGEVARFGRQVQAAQAIFGKRLLVLVMEDMQADFPAVSEQIQRFVGLAVEDLGQLPRLNPARTAKNAGLDRLAKRPPKALGLVRDGLKKALGTNSLGLRKRLDQINSQKIARVIPPGLRAEMRAHFRSDVILLGQCLGRDLVDEWGWS